MESSLMQSCVRRLSNGTQPGPDNIYNEVLKALPPPWITTIHHLFELMWATGYTPACLRHSHTIFLYKKGDHSDPANYRPLGLNNTLSKLWTSMVTRVLSTYSELNYILSDAQAGFRPNKNCHMHVLNLIHDIQDAALHHQDLYAAYFDFSNAFNMINHNHLATTMQDLGYTPDMIQAVRGIYTQATTSALHKGYNGPPIPIWGPPMHRPGDHPG